MAAPRPPPSPPPTAAAKRRRKAPQTAARPRCFAGRHGDGVRRAGRHLARAPGRARRTPLALGPAAPPALWEEPGVRHGGCGRAEPLPQRRAVPGGRVLAGPGGQGGPAEDERGLRAGTPAEESPARPRQPRRRLPGRAAGGARGRQLRHRRGEQRFVAAPGRRELPGAERGSWRPCRPRLLLTVGAGQRRCPSSPGCAEPAPAGSAARRPPPPDPPAVAPGAWREEQEVTGPEAPSPSPPLRALLPTWAAGTACARSLPRAALPRRALTPRCQRVLCVPAPWCDHCPCFPLQDLCTGFVPDSLQVSTHSANYRREV